MKLCIFSHPSASAHPHSLVYLSGHRVPETLDHLHVEVHILAWVVYIRMISEEVAGVCHCLVKVLSAS